jgi:hypothetical protein
VSARTVAKYIHQPTHRRPSPGWRLFLKQHAATIWACDFFCVQTIRYLRLIEAFKLERSLQYRCLEVSIMSISGPLDLLHQNLAPFLVAQHHSSGRCLASLRFTAASKAS